jgi:adenylate kinase family enzyme
MPTPRRIIILGPSGAGKSTLARIIGKRLSIPVVHLDAINWLPGWVQADVPTFRKRLTEFASQDAWVMDGNYSSHLDIRMPRTEAVIWLDLPRYVYFPRAVWRSIKNYGREREDVGPGNRERFEWSFFRNWVWTYPKRSRAQHAELLANLPTAVRCIILRSRNDVGKFIATLPHSLDSDTPRDA